jgi:molecular chaperone DnaK
MGRVVGIDLGTTYSCVALVENGKAKVIPSRHGDNTIPSILAHDAKGNVLVGYAAKRQSVINPRDTIYGAKRLMGRNYHTKAVDEIKTHFHYVIKEGQEHEAAIEVAGQHYELTDVSARILEEIKNVAQDYLDAKVDRAVISVPAYFNNKQREAVRKAGELAGLEVLRIINEPTAAALAYGFGKKLKEKILIYDLGGGTFDVTALELFEDVYEVIAVGGDSFLGGLDFDERLSRYCLDEFKRTEGVDLSGDALATQRIKDAAEKAKRDLTAAEKTEIVLPFITMVGGVSKTLKLTVTRQKFEELTADLVDRTLDILKKTLIEGKLSPEKIDDIVLVGGMTRMPKVQKALEQFFGKPAKKGVHPDEVVALGAAILANALESGQNPVTLVDVVPVPIGIALAGGRFRPIIDKNTSIPCEKIQVFPTSRDNQPAMRIRVFQGESDMVMQNELLGEFIFANLRPGKAGQVKLEVRFKLDNDCILHVAARDPDTGTSVSHSFSTEAAASRETYRADKVSGEHGAVTAGAAAAAAVKPAAPAASRPAAAPAAAKPAQPAAAPAKPQPDAEAKPDEKGGLLSRFFGKK